MHLKKIQAKITPINVPIFELPEYVCVETVCITQRFAMDNNIQGVLKITRSLANKLLDEKCETDNSNPPAQLAQSAPTKTQMMDYSKMTPDRIPCRDRSTQAIINTTVDVGVQCERESTDEWELAFELPTTTTAETDESLENEAKFLAYVSQHTSIFPNGMLECLVCGEIANVLPEHQSHMAAHFGPRELCSACGKMVGNHSLMAQHSYSCAARPNAKSRPIINMQCPHLHCSVMVNSKRELNKHLSKHLGIKSYYCLQCRKSFSSFTQFLVHRIRKAACFKAKHIYLAKTSARLRKKANPKRCTVCMKHFSSTRYCVWHKRRCILAYHKRLKKLLNLLCKDNAMNLA
ncbi:hypothetical protein ACLKA7_008034 [Drosophila subpalustris]